VCSVVAASRASVAASQPARIRPRKFARRADRHFAKGEALDTLLDFLFDEAIPRSFNTAAPALAFIQAAGSFRRPSAVLRPATNRYVVVFAAAQRRS
jgi:hypothetical protein